MKWRWVERSQGKLGSRVLREGCRGEDVLELQTMLEKAGFYFGPLDGIYGVLTEEAVNLAERTFHLPIDGKAGIRVIWALKQLSDKLGRLIYTVKSGENLEMISQKFDVSPKAWVTIAGQGSPRKRIFPGMKLLLPEKILLTWQCQRIKWIPVLSSGNLVPGGMMTSEGKLDLDENYDVALKTDYLVIDVRSEVFEKVVTSKSLKKGLLNEFKKMAKFKWGLDLRNIPLNQLGKWRSLLKELLAVSGRSKLIFVIVSIPLTKINQFGKYIIQELSGLFPYVRWMMVEPRFDGEATAFSAYWHACFKILPQLNRDSQYTVFPVFSDQAWQWHDTALYRLSWKEARLLGAQNYRSASYDRESMCTRVNYCKKGEEYQLCYRDIQGWKDLFDHIVKNDYPGLLLECSEIPTCELQRLLADAFKVLPREKLERFSG